MCYVAFGASVFANRFGGRATVIVGCILTVVGTILSVFSPNITTLIVTIGVIQGNLAQTYNNIPFLVLYHTHQLWNVWNFLTIEWACLLFGLSKEKPIFGDHPKAHIHEIWRISHEIWQISCEINRHSLPTALHKTEEFLLSYLIYKVFRWISWNLPDFTWNPLDFTKSVKFHEIRWISKDQLPRMVTPMFFLFLLLYYEISHIFTFLLCYQVKSTWEYQDSFKYQEN